MSNVKCPDPFRSLTEAVRELISAARSVNISKKHEVSGLSDDEPCYWQRKAWVDWLIENGEKAHQALEEFQKQQAQVVGRVHHNEEHAEPVRAVLKSIGRQLPDNAPLYAIPPQQPDAVSVPRELAERLAGFVGAHPSGKGLAEELRALSTRQAEEGQPCDK